MGDFLALTSSVRNSLGPSVECMLRAMQSMQNFDVEGEGKPPMFVEGPYQEKTTMKNATMAFHDLRVAPLDAVPGIDAALGILRKNLIETVNLCGQSLDEAKRSVQVYFGQISKVEAAMRGGSDFIEPVRNATKNPDDAAKSVQGKVSFEFPWGGWSLVRFAWFRHRCR